MEMAKAIARTKREIAGTDSETEDAATSDTADASDVESVVSATEQATSGILAAAEQIQEVAWTMREQGTDTRLCDQLDARASDIYQACSMQNFRGQRTQKVMQGIRELEGRINAMIDVWDLEPATSQRIALPTPLPIETNDGDDDAQSPGDADAVGSSASSNQVHRGNVAANDDATPEARPRINGATNGAAHDIASSNGHIVLDHEGYPLAASTGTKADAAAADDIWDDGATVEHAAPPKLFDAAAPEQMQTAEPISVAGTADVFPLSDFTDMMGLVFPTDVEGEPVPLRPQEQPSAPVVVMPEPAQHSGTIVIAPEGNWANTAAIHAMTAPAFESVLVISDDEAARESALSDLFALHVERSLVPPEVRLQDALDELTGMAMPVPDPVSESPASDSADLDSTVAVSQSNHAVDAQSDNLEPIGRVSPVQFDLEPLVVSAEFNPSALIDEPAQALTPDTSDDSGLRSNVITLPQSTTVAPAPDVLITPAATAASFAPTIVVDNVSVEPVDKATTETATPSTDTPIATESSRAAMTATPQDPARVAPANTDPAPLSKSSPMAPEVRVVRTAPPPVDPLAPITALSAEEKIALFS
jgi:hypothetical protein